MRRWLLAAVTTLGLLPATAMADRMSYSYIQLTDQVNSKIDKGSLSETDNGRPGVKFGWIMGPYVFADVRYDDLDYNNGRKGHEGEARLGWRQRLLYAEGDEKRLDFFALASYEDLQIKHVFDKTGFGLNAGLRFSPVKWFELLGELGYLDYGSPYAWAYTVDAQFNASRYWAFVFEYRKQDFNNSGPDLSHENFNLGFRFQFGGG